MKYEGELYGKVGRKHIPLTATTKDWKDMKKRIAELESELAFRNRVIDVLAEELRTDSMFDGAGLAKNGIIKWAEAKAREAKVKESTNENS